MIAHLGCASVFGTRREIALKGKPGVRGVAGGRAGYRSWALLLGVLVVVSRTVKRGGGSCAR